MNRVDAAFAAAAIDGRLVLSPFVTIGYPDIETSVQLALAYCSAGVDALELGVPFSDPIADGPTIQRASQHALEHGVTLDDCLRSIERIRAEADAALLLMGYANPFMQRGYDRLANELGQAGGDGLIVPDILPEAGRDLSNACQVHDLRLISFMAPTTPPERIKRIASTASGFIYCVSLTGVTGARENLSTELPAFLARVRKATDLPRVVGFGISTPEHLLALRKHAEGAIVASALIDIIDAAPSGCAIAAAATYVKRLVEAAQCKT